LNDQHYELKPIGWVESPLVDRAAAPKQGDEGSPDAWLAFDARFRDGLRDLRVGDEVIVLTWLDRARRDVLVVHPRCDPANPLQGVFNTRPRTGRIRSDCTAWRFLTSRAQGSAYAIWRRWIIRR
jgi:tRNA (Thr-GGU) A37 N-methylase